MTFAERKNKNPSHAGRLADRTRSKDAVAPPVSASARCACGGGCPRCQEGASALQPRRAISRPGDPLERQADQTAEQIMRTPAPVSVRPTHGGAAVARKPVGSASTPAPSEAPPAVHQALNSPGQALDGRTRDFFEPHFGMDLGDVRIHADGGSGRAARAVNAQAFTHGGDIVFDSGAYQPESDAGRRLLAHELTHVVQQAGGEGAGTLQRTAYSDCSEEQEPTVRAATRAAINALGPVVSRLRQRPLTQHVSDALWLMFRDRSTRMASYVQGVLGDIYENLPGATIECEQPEDLGYGLMCREDAGGYVRIGSIITGIGNIHLCMGEWEDKSDAVRMHIVLHEAAHLHARTEDYGYFNTEDCTETAATAAAATTPPGITPVTRSNNADCYACLARMLGVMSASDVAARVGLYQGDTLEIRQSPPGDINLAAGEQSTAFTVGIPAADDPMRMDIPIAFQFRWVLRDAQGNDYDMQELFGGGRVRRFGPNQTTVIIPDATRALLRQRGVTRATLYGRYYMQGVGQRLYWLPVRFTVATSEGETRAPEVPSE